MVRKTIRAAIVAAVAGLGILASSGIAQAATYTVSGELNTGGHLVQYSTYRSHINGNSSLAVTNNVGAYSRFGLRDLNGVQITQTNQYNGSGGDQPFRTNGGSLTIPTGQYAINGRMGACTLCDRFWGGTLVL